MIYQIEIITCNHIIISICKEYEKPYDGVQIVFDRNI